MACATVFPSDTELSMRLPDSASIFTAEIWAIIKNAFASKFIIFTDSAAKSALDLPHAQVGVPYTDFKHLISQYMYIFSTWQDDWNGAVANKFHSVKPALGDWQSS